MKEKQENIWSDESDGETFDGLGSKLEKQQQLSFGGGASVTAHKGGHQTLCRCVSPVEATCNLGAERLSAADRGAPEGVCGGGGQN